MTVTVRWAATLAGLAVLAVLVAVLVSTAGLFGFAHADTGGGDQVTATVTVGTSCDHPDSRESVRLRLDGADRTALLDACGHNQNDVVSVTVPTGRPATESGELVVHAAQATQGVDDTWRPIGLGLLVVAGLAGAGYALLYLRQPGEPLPELPWLKQSSGKPGTPVG